MYARVFLVQVLCTGLCKHWKKRISWDRKSGQVVLPCLRERCSSSWKLCHLLTSFFSPLSKNRIPQHKGERGTARERQRGWREKRQMRWVLVPPAVIHRVIYHLKKEEALSTPSWPFTTHPNIHRALSFTHITKHKYQLHLQGTSVSVLSMKATYQSVHTHTVSWHCRCPTPAGSFWSLSLSINYSISLFQHHLHPSPFPLLLSIHPSFLLSLSFYPSAGTVVVFWQGHGHRLAHTSLLSAAALNGFMIWFLVPSLLDIHCLTSNYWRVVEKVGCRHWLFHLLIIFWLLYTVSYVCKLSNNRKNAQSPRFLNCFFSDG